MSAVLIVAGLHKVCSESCACQSDILLYMPFDPACDPVQARLQA
jgi:hypothetical protein